MNVPGLRRSIEIESTKVKLKKPKTGPHDGAHVERTAIASGRYWRPTCYCGKLDEPATMDKRAAQRSVDRHVEEANARDVKRRGMRKAGRA